MCKLNVVHESCASKELVAGQCANKLYHNSNLVIMTIPSIYCEVVNGPKCTIHESTKVDIPPIASYTSPWVYLYSLIHPSLEDMAIVLSLNGACRDTRLLRQSPKPQYFD